MAKKPVVLSEDELDTAVPADLSTALALLEMYRRKDEEEAEPKTLEEAKQVIAALKKSMASQAAVIQELKKPLEFEYVHGRPLMVVKLGSSHNGWIPNALHFEKVRKVLKASGEDKKSNILLYHYGISIERNSSFGAA